MSVLMFFGVLIVFLVCLLGFELHFIVSLIIAILSIPVLMLIFGKAMENENRRWQLNKNGLWKDSFSNKYE